MEVGIQTLEGKDHAAYGVFVQGGDKIFDWSGIKIDAVLHMHFHFLNWRQARHQRIHAPRFTGQNNPLADFSCPHFEVIVRDLQPLSHHQNAGREQGE